ncbi:hypothetical protein QUB63_10685 [Microcoleus sp. ARI1-B5]
MYFSPLLEDFSYETGVFNPCRTPGTSDQLSKRSIAYQNDIPNLGTSDQLSKQAIAYQNDIPNLGTSDQLSKRAIAYQNDIPNLGTSDQLSKRAIEYQNNLDNFLNPSLTLNSQLSTITHDSHLHCHDCLQPRTLPQSCHRKRSRPNLSQL